MTDQRAGGFEYGRIDLARDVAVIVFGAIAMVFGLTTLLVGPGVLLYAVFGPWGAIGWAGGIGLLCLGGGHY